MDGIGGGVPNITVLTQYHSQNGCNKIINVLAKQKKQWRKKKGRKEDRGVGEKSGCLWAPAKIW